MRINHFPEIHPVEFSSRTEAGASRGREAS
jgi:hypothetical protein